MVYDAGARGGYTPRIDLSLLHRTYIVHILPDRLMVGHMVLVHGIEVRVLVGQQSCETDRVS